MSSILTNNSAMVALATLKDVNRGLNETQNRVSSGLQISSGKDNAAYFAISETMKGDSGMFKAINEGMTATKNSVATARLGAETVSDLAQQMVERIAFAQSDGVDKAAVQSELDALAENMQAAIDQATFNGDDLVSGAAAAVTVVTGISRAGGTFGTTTMSFNSVNLQAIQDALSAIDLTTSGNVAADLVTAEVELQNAISAATSLGVTENSLDGQMQFVESLTDTIDSGVSSMVDADMEQEAARLQAYQVQQQLATQSLSIANQAPQNILSLFR
ncbi:flagellar protein [Sulfitobacter sp. JBTF-M27]|uniref:Flagellin n=1 Tax=Sulfitobacter sediminilitoris TaxID=2698830 RepID=A0A6P0CC89_9RHOB|nr:flagellin [Sulfitobacter sediminilitoris]NEK23809.1 flagellar protein [Sulfitobacter sediminilitoris]